LRDQEGELTEAQAREAIVEAECTSVKKILSKTTEALEKHQETVITLKEESKILTDTKIELESRVNSLNREKESSQVLILKLHEQLGELQQREGGEKALMGKIQNFQIQIQNARESLEDWVIITKMALEVIAKHYKDWLSIQQMANLPQSPEIYFQDIMNVDPGGLSQDFDLYLGTLSALARQTYGKIGSVSALSSTNITLNLKTQLTGLRSELGSRLSFRR
jgi:hypothetical protein